MDFLNECLKLNSEYEINKNYTIWSGITLISALINRKVHFLHGAIKIHPPLYSLLVGPQGNGKSTAKNHVLSLFKAVCPNLELGASTQSAEDIVKTMASDKFRTDSFINHKNEEVVSRPYAFFINEFKNFIAYNPTRMLNFLGDIYDAPDVFDSSTIKRGLECVYNPCLTILACENPDQLVGFMKNNVMSGGISRRFIVVNELDYADPKAIIKPMEYEDNPTWCAIRDRLKEVRKMSGRYKWDPASEGPYVLWYEDKHRSLSTITNPIMKGYISTKHTQLFRVMMCLDAVSPKPMMMFTTDLMDHSLLYLDAIELNMPLLSMAAGRNELAIHYHRCLERLKNSVLELDGLKIKGGSTEKQFMRELESDMSALEILHTIRYLCETDQIVKKTFNVTNGEGTPISRSCILLFDVYAECVKSGKFKVRKT